MTTIAIDLYSLAALPIEMYFNNPSLMKRAVAGLLIETSLDNLPVA
jgi:hypothetical protein